MKNLIDTIARKNKDIGVKINPPATSEEISEFQKHTSLILPKDFIDFYRICNGFECTDDIFNVLSLEEIRSSTQWYDKNTFTFAEYMISSEEWCVRLLKNGTYQFFFRSNNKISSIESVHQFITAFSKGNVFEKGGLYDLERNL